MPNLKTSLLLATASYVFLAAPAGATGKATSQSTQSAAPQFAQPLVKLTADLTWASKYISDGFLIGGNDPVVQPSVNLDILDSGAAVMVWSALRIDRKNQQYDEVDLMARYSRTFLKEQKYAFNFHGFYDYWFYPRTAPVMDSFGNTLSSEQKRGNKLHAGISLPQILPLFGSFIVPSYNAYYWVYWEQNRRDVYRGGTRHEALLQYNHWIPRFIPGALAQYAGLSGSANYNDGALGVHPGWSHSTAGLFTNVYALASLFTLTLNRQWSYEPSVNPRNEIWSTLSYTKSF